MVALLRVPTVVFGQTNASTSIVDLYLAAPQALKVHQTCYLSCTSCSRVGLCKYANVIEVCCRMAEKKLRSDGGAPGAKARSRNAGFFGLGATSIGGAEKIIVECLEPRSLAALCCTSRTFRTGVWKLSKPPKLASALEIERLRLLIFSIMKSLREYQGVAAYARNYVVGSREKKDKMLAQANDEERNELEFLDSLEESSGREATITAAAHYDYIFEILLGTIDDQLFPSYPSASTVVGGRQERLIQRAIDFFRTTTFEFKHERSHPVADALSLYTAGFFESDVPLSINALPIPEFKTLLHRVQRMWRADQTCRERWCPTLDNIIPQRITAVETLATNKCFSKHCNVLAQLRGRVPLPLDPLRVRVHLA
jgi:hypothetical protein